MVWWLSHSFLRERIIRCCLLKCRISPGCKALERCSVCRHRLDIPTRFCGGKSRKSDSEATRRQCAVLYSEGRLDLGQLRLESLGLSNLRVTETQSSPCSCQFSDWNYKYSDRAMAGPIATLYFKRRRSFLIKWYRLYLELSPLL